MSGFADGRESGTERDVRVSRTTRCTRVLTVRGRSEEEAEAAALDLARRLRWEDMEPDEVGFEVEETR